MENNNKPYNSLAGKFLIASPSMNDPRFVKCIIYMISDNEEGSMGIIINKPAIDIKLENIIEATELKRINAFSTKKISQNKKEMPKVFYGGPVELDKGFILHSNDYFTKEKYTDLSNNLVLSSNFSILQDIIKGKGPSKCLLAVGYSGWYSNQLANELKQNTWIEAELDTDILFSKNISKKWEFALTKVGINKKKLSTSSFSSFSGSA